jgi:hypothetical protein
MLFAKLVFVCYVYHELYGILNGIKNLRRIVKDKNTWTTLVLDTIPAVLWYRLWSCIRLQDSTVSQPRKPQSEQSPSWKHTCIGIFHHTSGVQLSTGLCGRAHPDCPSEVRSVKQYFGRNNSLLGLDSFFYSHVGSGGWAVENFPLFGRSQDII